MSKRKNGPMTVPLTFTTRHYDILKDKDNRSAFIDAAIEYYNVNINSAMRGFSEREVTNAERLRAMDFVRDNIGGNTLVEITCDQWVIRARIADSNSGGEEE